MKRVVVIASTGGSVLSKVIHIPTVKESLYTVVSDRQCQAIEVAKKFGLKVRVLESATGEEFSKKLVQSFKNEQVDIFLSFYTKLFSAEFVDKYKGKVLNFHPSILPACPGMDGFGDTIKSGAMFIGSTLHFVDNGVDTGKILIQSMFPYQPTLTIKENRHRVFVQQCKIFVQFIEWLTSERIINQELVDAQYELSEFVPNLDSTSAITLDIPYLDGKKAMQEG